MHRPLFVLALCCSFGAVAFAGEKKFTPIDLKGHFNHKPGDKNDDAEGNDLPLPLGEQVIDGITMEIGERVVQLGCKIVPERPEKIEGIKVDRKLAKLYILHATGFGGGGNTPGTPFYVEDGTFIGEYRINYEDKSSENIAIEYGKDVRDFWYREDREDEKETSRAKVVWKGDNNLARQYSCRLRLYLTTWTNPKPEQKIVSIDYLSRKDETVAAPFCVAMTAEE